MKKHLIFIVIAMIFSTALYAEFLTSAYSGNGIVYLAQEGSTVKKGEPLVKYDTNYQKIKIEREELQLKICEAKLKDLKTDIKRSSVLYKKEAISLAAHENTIVTHFKCEVSARKSKLDIEMAKNNLSWYTVNAPYDCKVIKQYVCEASGTKKGDKIPEIHPIN